MKRAAAIVDGAVRGAVIGVGFSAVMVAAAVAVTRIGDAAPDDLRSGYELAARWAFGTLSCALGVCVAGALYMLLWRRHRRHGWHRREGGRVIAAGIISYVAVSSVGFVTRIGAVSAGELDSAGSPPPTWALIAGGPVVYAIVFAQAARRATRHDRPRRDDATPPAAQPDRRVGR